MFNNHIRGWINYYGRFYKSALYPALRHIDRISGRTDHRGAGGDRARSGAGPGGAHAYRRAAERESISRATKRSCRPRPSSSPLPIRLAGPKTQRQGARHPILRLRSPCSLPLRSRRRRRVQTRSAILSQRRWRIRRSRTRRARALLHRSRASRSLIKSQTVRRRSRVPLRMSTGPRPETQPGRLRLPSAQSRRPHASMPPAENGLSSVQARSTRTGRADGRAARKRRTPMSCRAIRRLDQARRGPGRRRETLPR